MIDKDVALEALSTLCHASVTSVQKGSRRGASRAQQQLLTSHFISTTLHADDSSQVSGGNFCRLQSALQGVDAVGGRVVKEVAPPAGRNFIIDEDEFFDPRFNYDFTNLKDTQTYSRGGETYERPCGWQRFAIKVLDKYSDGNTWLGTRYCSTESVPGEWPVSYHGTSKAGAAGIIHDFFKPGPGVVYGRGVYSTPLIAEAIHYAKTFTYNKTGKKYQVILQNRINPKYRQKHNGGKYWLIPIPAGTSKAEEQKMVEEAIRPYGLLLREV